MRGPGLDGQPCVRVRVEPFAYIFRELLEVENVPRLRGRERDKGQGRAGESACGQDTAAPGAGGESVYGAANSMLPRSTG